GFFSPLVGLSPLVDFSPLVGLRRVVFGVDPVPAAASAWAVVPPLLDLPDPLRRRRRGRAPDGAFGAPSVALSSVPAAGVSAWAGSAAVSSIIDASPSSPGRDERRERG